MQSSDVELGCLIGRGTYGVVYTGTLKAKNEHVAVKILELDTVGDDLDDIMKEIRNMWELKGDRHVVNVYGSFTHGTQLWIVMEFVGGGTIQELRQRVELPEPAIAIILREMLEGIQYLHAQGKIHRDIKAANILLTSDAKVKLADFGISAQLTDSIRKRHTFIGSPYWMAPEVVMQSGHNQKADIWSVGITALEIADGYPPYFGENPIAVVMKIPRNLPPRLKNEEKWSSEFHDFIRSALEKNPEIRPTASELLQHPFLLNAEDPEKLKDFIGDDIQIKTYEDFEKNSSRENSSNPSTASSAQEKDDGWDF